MALMTTAEHKSVGHDWAYDGTASGRLPLSKDERIAVATAMDQWIENNKASLHAAVLAVGGGPLSVQQEVEGFIFVIRRRFEVDA